MSPLAWLILAVLVLIIGMVIMAALIDRANRKRHEATRDLAEFVKPAEPFRWDGHGER